jgi:methionyl-tRNA formyltransferase
MNYNRFARRVKRPHMRLLYCGTTGSFSLQPLWQLLAAGFTVGAILVPGRTGESGAAPIEELTAGDPITEKNRMPDLTLPVVNRNLTQSIVQVGWERGIPVFRANRLDHPETVRLVAEMAVDVACVACFPWRIPGALLDVPPAGFLNLHPSLLPAYRGPAPLFWAFRNGEQETGVTVHFMAETLDTGDIVLQAPVALPDGISGSEAESRCAARGGQLLVEAVRALASGTVPRRPQPPGGHYHSWPSPKAFRLTPDWPARRAFNFMRGTAEWQQPYSIHINGKELTLQAALSFSATEFLDQAYLRSGRSIRIQFSPGVVDALLTRVAGAD